MPAQRWRLTFERGTDAPDATQREQAAAWQDAVRMAGLGDPSGTDPPRVMPALPVSAHMTGAREVADLLLPARWRCADLRARLDGAMPPGHRLLDLHDVWLGEPALPGIVVAADYRIEIIGQDGGRAAENELREAADAVLAARTVLRTRTRGTQTTQDDLRPFIADLDVREDGFVRARLWIDPAAGTARAEEVAAGLALLANRTWAAGLRHRERIWLRGEPMAALSECPYAAGGSSTAPSPAVHSDLARG